VSLRHLALSVLLRTETVGGDGSPPSAGRGEDDNSCRFCGGIRGQVELGHDDGSTAHACALCQLVLRLDRPRIDDEAMLIWLPEMSQPALNMLMRGIQSRLRALGEPLYVESTPALDTEDRPWLYLAQQALLARREAASARLGTDRPSELADALLRLSPSAYARRRQLLGGVRLLASGRFFDGEADVLPQIVDSWRSQPPAETTGTSP
jgi:hypothetical protein